MSLRVRFHAFLVLTSSFAFGAGRAGAQDLQSDSRGPGNMPRQHAFAPVQSGPVSSAPNVSTHAAGRFLVQFKTAAVQGSALAGIAAKGARGARISSGPAVGLPSIDALNSRSGVFRVERAHIAARQTALAQQLGLDRWFMLYVPDDADVFDLVARYGADANVDAVTPDWRAFPAVVPNDPLHPIHWGHNNTAQMKNYCWNCGGHDSGTPVGTVGFDADAQPAWDAAQGYGSTSVVIAILDSGVDTGHPDLRQVTGFDFGDNDSNPNDDSAAPGHGTACAGVAAAIANNALGAAGAAGGCSIMPLKVADSGGSLFFSYIQNGLMYASDNGADVASMSFGAAITSDPATDNALVYAFNGGVTLLAATGNENKTTISYPAVHTNVIGVGAASPCGQRKRSSSLASELNPGVSADPNGYTCDGERWWGSNYGSTTQNAAGAVDLIAPTILPTTDIRGAGGYAAGDYSNWFNGTSCSTPYAAGVAALIESANPTWTPTQVRTRLLSSAVDVTSVESAAGWDRYAGAGMVNAQGAVAGGTASVTVTAPNGGETLTIGASTNITWTSTGTIANVALEYSVNGGSTWTSIVASTPNDGSQSWTVPSSATTQGRVRVSDATNAAVNDISNANFTIQAAPTPTVTVIAPNGGETLTIGANTNITWSSTGTIANVALAYSTNGGSTWTTILASTPNDGSQAWTVPSAATTQGRVRVSDAANAAVNDISNANFTIQAASTYATLPYTTGFESGALDGFWVTAVTANGRVRILTTNTPHTGTRHMVMDDATSGGLSQTEAWLRLNLSGQTNVALSFWWKDFGDETHTQDGVYFSSNGGSSFVKVQALNGGSYTDNVWRQFNLDLDALAASNGLTLTSTFVVKFQQYDDYPITTDGHAYDDISVTAVTGGSYITAESEANNTSGTADGPMGPAVAVSGSISSSTDDDWFFFDVATAGNINISLSIGGSADLDWFLYNSSLVEVARGYTVSNPETGNYTAAAGHYYLFVDGYQGATSAYTLTLNGGIAKTIEVTAAVPKAFALHPNAPNPFNPTTKIRFDVPRHGHVSVDVFDARGRIVANLVSADFEPGYHSVVWHGRDANGQPVASGVYLASMRAQGFARVHKMLLVK